MIAFLTIIYVAAVVVIFKVLKVIFKVLKVNPRPWPIAIMATVGIAMLGTIIVLWTLAAPISTKAVVTRYVVQIVPYVKGQVVNIPAKPNVPLKTGGVLYEVDPTPYQYTVDQVQAQLHAAEDTVTQLEAGVRVAEANIKKAQTDVAATKAALDVALAIEKANPQAISKLKLVQAREQNAAAMATLEVAQATEAQAQSSVASAKQTIVSIEAQLKSAQFNLTECTARAPADGFITDWQIRKGTFVTAMPFAAAGTFVDTSETKIVAAFSAQMLIDVKPGQDVELAFKSRPGQLFKGKVEDVIQASGEGQFTTGGKLPTAASIGSPGILAVKIGLNDSSQADELAMGTPGAVAIYTDWGKPFAMISKVTIRLKKWMYFLPLP